MIAINKGVEIPRSRRERQKYPFNEMEIGDSFFVPSEDQNERRKIVARLLGNVRSSRIEKKFTTRVMSNDPIARMPGVRIWRVK